MVGDGLQGRLDLCGVRLTRGSPVVFVDPWGHTLDPFQLVVVALPEGETLAIVVVAPGQLVENEARVEPRGRVVRVASPEDIAAFDRQHRAEPDAIAPMHADLQAAGLPPGWSDWLVPPGAQPSVLRMPETAAEPRSARAFIDRLFPEPPRGR